MGVTLQQPRVAADLSEPRRLVARRLASARWRMRSYLLTDGLLWTVGVALLLGALSLAGDWLLRMSTPARVGLLVASVAVVLTVAYRRLIRPQMLRLSDLDVAEILDRRLPGVGQRMANVLQLPRLLEHEPHASASMIRQAVVDQARELQRVDLRSVFNTLGQRRRSAALALLALLVVAFFELAPGTAGLWARRFFSGSNERWPQRTYLSLVGLDGQPRLLTPRGEPLLLQVDAQPEFERVAGGWSLAGRETPLIVPADMEPASVVPERVDINYRAENGDVKAGVFTHYEGADFRYELPPVTEPLEISISGGDDWLGPVRIEPIDRPAIETIEIISQAPGSKQTRTQRAGAADAQLVFLPQTKLELRFRASQPLASAAVLSGGAPLSGLASVDDRDYSLAWEMQEPLTLEIRLTGRDGGLTSKPYYLTIGLLNDREPRVSVRSSGVGRRVTPQARVPIALRATDDFGVVELAIELEQTVFEDEKPRVSTAQVFVEPLETAPAPPTEIDRKQQVSLREQGLPAGATIRLRASAKDNCVLGAHTGYSRWLSLQVVTPEELFYEVLMRQREQRAKFAQALAAARKQGDALAELSKPEQAAPLVRSHQVIARQVWQVANQLDASLEEMTLNELGNAQARDLLKEKIIEPLRKLHDEELARLRTALDALAGAPKFSSEQSEAASRQQAETIDAMQRILEQMAQWESFVDVVNQLKQVIQLQNQILESTEKIRKQKEKDLFD